MARLPDREQRPGVGTEALSKITGEAIGSSVAAEADLLRDLLTRALDLLTPRPRCRRCGHPLTAEASVRRGIGPVCLSREGVGA